MDDVNACNDTSWKKIVITKANDEWRSSVKSDGESKLSNTNKISDDQIPFIEIKIEKDTIETILEDTDEFCDEQVTDPLHEMKKRGRKKSETPEERASRLAKMSAYAAQRLANETPEQRASRLKRMSEYTSKRLAQETSAQRARRLARMSAYAAKRLANETMDQRQARLARMSAYAAKRKALRKITKAGQTDSNEMV